MAYKTANFEESVLLLLEHFYRKDPTPENFYLLLKSLLRNNNYEAVKWMVARYSMHFGYEKIKKIYIEAMKRIGLLSEIDPSLEVSGKELKETRVEDFEPISNASIKNYYQALIQKGKDKKKKHYIDKAIKHDERNLEALIYVGVNYSAKELEKYLREVKSPEISALFKEIMLQTPSSFSVFGKEFYSPFSCCRIAKELFNTRRTNELFQLAQYMGNLYPKHYFTYVTAGLYYILIEKRTDAKRALFKSIQMNNTFGTSWLLLGYCQSSLCECISAVNCYEKAELLMEENYLATLGIALEYHRMRNYRKAEEKYVEIQKKHGLEKCLNQYVSLLVSQGRCEEALECMNGAECAGDTGLLRSFCCIITSNEEGAEQALENVNISFEQRTKSKYYLLKGFIYHIQKKYCEAIEAYQKAILDPFTSQGGLVNDLLELAIKNSLDRDDRKLIHQYGEDVFDFLDLKSELPLEL